MQNIFDLKKSVKCALDGVLFTVNKERNFRIHIVCACYVLYFSKYYSLSRTDVAVLFLTIALVMCLEMVNTAVEEVVDRISPNYNLFAKHVKDIAAGGVFVAAIFAVFVGMIYFLDIKIILFIFKDIFSSLKKLMIFFLSVFISFLFVFNNKQTK